MPNQISEFWDVNEDKAGKRWPNLSTASTARVMQTLLKLDGRLHDSMIEGEEDESDRMRLVSYRISLPVGYQWMFEEMTGYRLTRPPSMGVN